MRKLYNAHPFKKSHSERKPKIRTRRLFHSYSTDVLFVCEKELELMSVQFMVSSFIKLPPPQPTNGYEIQP